MSEENKTEGLLRAFEEFKNANDDRLKQLEAKNSADYVTTDKVDRINSALTEMQDEIKSMSKKAGRPGASEETSETEYRQAFDTFIRKGDENELKAMNLTGAGTGDDGGHTVPKVINMAVRDQLVDLSPLRRLARVETTTTGDYSILLNVHGTGAGWVGETAARPNTASSQIKKIAVPHGEIYANVPVTQQLLDDSAMDVEGYIAREIALKFAQLEGEGFLNGDGVDKPSGLLAGAGTATGFSAVNSGAAAALTADGLINLAYAPGAGYRQNASFLMSSATEAAVRKLKDTTNNYLWAPGLNGGAGSLLGKTVNNDENMAAVAAGSFSIAFGDFVAGYVIAQRKSITMLRDPYTAKPYINFYAVSRVGGAKHDLKAVFLLKTSA